MRQPRGVVLATVLALLPPLAGAMAQPAAGPPDPRLVEAARLFAGAGVPRDQRRACDIAEALATGNGQAAAMAGDCHYHGEGRARDRTLSRQYYERAIALGHTAAHCALGNQYFDGDGVPQDSERGLQLCRVAAAAGSADAMADLGQRYLRGVGLPRSSPDAIAWLTQAAAAGHAIAADDLARVYSRGDGVARDPAAAMRWWIEAVRTGRVTVAYDIAMAATEVLGGTALDDAARREAQENVAYWSALAMRVDPDPARRRRAGQLHREALGTLVGESRMRVLDAMSRLPPPQHP